MFDLVDKNQNWFSFFDKTLPKPIINPRFIKDFESNLVENKISCSYILGKIGIEPIETLNLVYHDNFHVLLQSTQDQTFDLNVNIVKVNGSIKRPICHKSCKGDYYEFTDVPCFGVKVGDVVKIFQQLYSETIDSEFNEREKVLLKKILKTEVSDKYTGVLCSTLGSRVTLIDQTSQIKFQGKSFADKLVLFGGASDIHSWFKIFHETRHTHKVEAKIVIDDKLRKFMGNFPDQINADLVKCLTNIYFFNLPYEESEEGLHIFEEPKSLLNILREYHPDDQLYYRIKNMIKPTDIKEILFKSLKNFEGKESEIFKLHTYDKIYLLQWDENKDLKTLNGIFYQSLWKVKGSRGWRCSWDQSDDKEKFDLAQLLEDDVDCQADDFWGDEDDREY